MQARGSTQVDRFMPAKVTMTSLPIGREVPVRDLGTGLAQSEAPAPQRKPARHGGGEAGETLEWSKVRQSSRYLN
jgi:hypothetical protein